MNLKINFMVQYYHAKHKNISLSYLEKYLLNSNVVRLAK
jgi:hypothetical protein